MVLSIFGIDQTGNNNRVKIDQDNNLVVMGGGSEATTQGQFEKAVREGRAFTAATSRVVINSQRYLNIIFNNPANSGKNAFFTARKLQGNRINRSCITYGFVANPAIPGSMDSLPGVNRKTGGAASTLEVWSSESETRIDQDPPLANPTEGFVPNAGLILNLDDEVEGLSRMVPPGNSFGLYIFTDGYDAERDQARVVMTWVEEDV